MNVFSEYQGGCIDSLHVVTLIKGSWILSCLLMVGQTRSLLIEGYHSTQVDWIWV